MNLSTKPLSSSYFKKLDQIMGMRGKAKKDLNPLNEIVCLSKINGIITIKKQIRARNELG